MIKKLPAAVLFVFASAGVCAAQLAQPTDRDLDGLVGPVKSVEEDRAEVVTKGGKLTEGARRPYRSVTYDRQGRMTRRWQDVSGSSPVDQSYSYDKDGIRRVRSRRNASGNSSPDSGGEGVSLHVFRFEADKNTLHQDVYVGDTPSPRARTQRYSYRFDAGGRVAERVMYTPEGEAAVRDVYTYDGAGRHPTERRLYGLGKPTPQIIKYAYTLDRRGNWVKRVEENTLANPDRTRRDKVTYRKISYY